MSKDLAERVDRLELIIMGLMDEIVELKQIRQELQAQHVNQRRQQLQQAEAERIQNEIDQRLWAAQQQANLSAARLNQLTGTFAPRPEAHGPALPEADRHPRNGILGGLGGLTNSLIGK